MTPAEIDALAKRAAATLPMPSGAGFDIQVPSLSSMIAVGEMGEALKGAFARIAQLEAELAKEKGGWDAFYKLRKSVGEERYPHLTGDIKASSAQNKSESP